MSTTDPTGQNDLVCAKCGADVETRQRPCTFTKDHGLNPGCIHCGGLGFVIVEPCPQCGDDRAPILRSVRKATLDEERARIEADIASATEAGPYKPCPQCGVRADGELRLLPGCDACDHTGYVLRSPEEESKRVNPIFSRVRLHGTKTPNEAIAGAERVVPIAAWTTQGQKANDVAELEGLKAWMEQVVAKALHDQGDIRDIFASRAMSALVRIGTSPEFIAQEAYTIADAMMNARKPKEAEPEKEERILPRMKREIARERRIVGNYIRSMTALSKQAAEDHASFIEAGHHRAGVEALACLDLDEPEEAK